jgi:hypothetical protein
MKSTARGKNFPPSGGQQHPFKGGRQEHSGGGELGDSWGRVGEREGPPVWRKMARATVAGGGT